MIANHPDLGSDYVAAKVNASAASSVKGRPSSDVRTRRAYDVYVTNMFILSYLLVGLNGYSSPAETHRLPIHSGDRPPRPRAPDRAPHADGPPPPPPDPWRGRAARSPLASLPPAASSQVPNPVREKPVEEEGGFVDKLSAQEWC